MNNVPVLEIELKTGTYKRGEPYPEYDFSVAEKHGIFNKAGIVAGSNQQLKQQIEERLKVCNDSQVTYTYYVVEEK